MLRVLDLQEALIELAQGRVIAVPTDTVYGVAARVDAREGIEGLFVLKGRPKSLALPVLVDSIEQIVALGVDWPARAQRLASRFWPGALTIVVPTPDQLARSIASDSSSVGFRIPDLAMLRELLVRGGPLAVTSANRHGEPPCQRAQQVLEIFADSPLLGGVLDAGERDARVSTVVDVTSESWRILRIGAIDGESIRDALA
ncbi:MAG: threonylcarbamoyl-AMP synthase [Acidimicrobiaceae bacterium]|nr:threonylcarbamoyl-AMP synthase [Acidimicrobiaceae bacterium]